MKSWTRTLNLDDAHSLLALAEPGLSNADWAAQCHATLPDLSVARRRELIRILRDDFLEWKDDLIVDGLFLNVYANSPATAQIDLMSVQWALSHPITLIATEHLIAPALTKEDKAIPLEAVESLVAEALETDSKESRRKTRTVLLGALEGLGTLTTRGTGQHRSIAACRAEPHPMGFGYLILRELKDRGLDAMMASEVTETSLSVRLTQCTESHAQQCLDWSLKAGILLHSGDEIGAPSNGIWS